MENQSRLVFDKLGLWLIFCKHIFKKVLVVYVSPVFDMDEYF